MWSILLELIHYTKFFVESSGVLHVDRSAIEINLFM